MKNFSGASALAALSLFLSLPAMAKYNVCTVTINSTNEVQAFKAKLNPAEFEFTELTKFGDSQNKSAWFSNACSAGIKCDVLIISGHFGGSFFGKDNDISLSLKDLNKVSCDNSCDGIVKNLKEVYLFGCNTLAGKTKDHRTPEEYLRVLLDDNIDGPEAQRIVSARYGPFGSSFSDQMSRVFEEAAIIYGFDGVAPSGANVAPSLKKFLSDLGNYKSHIDARNTSSGAKIWNQAMVAYNRTTIAGITKRDAGYSIKAKMCYLQDDSKGIEERLRAGMSSLEEDNVLYMPSVARFVTENIQSEPDGNSPEVRATIGQMRANRNVENKVNELIGVQGVVLSDKIDLLEMKRRIGWITNQVFDNTMKKMFSDRLKTPSRANVDALCSLLDSGDDYRKYADVSIIAAYDFSKKEHFELVSCSEAQKKSEALTEKATQAFAENWPRFKKESAEAFWVSAWAVSEGKGSIEKRYQILSQALLGAPSYMGESPEQLKKYVLSPVAPPAVIQQWINQAKAAKDAEEAADAIYQVSGNQRLSADNLISILDASIVGRIDLWRPGMLFTGDPSVEKKFVQAWSYMTTSNKYMMVNHVASGRAIIKSQEMRDLFGRNFLQGIKASPISLDIASAEAASQMKLSPVVLKQVYEVYKSKETESFLLEAIRHVLFKNNGHVVFNDLSIQTGTKSGMKVKFDDDGDSNSSTYTYIN